MAERLIQVLVPTDCEAIRIDKFLSQHPEIKTRSRAEYLIINDCVSVNSKIVRSSYKVKPNDSIEIIITDISSSEPLQKLDLALDIVFEDRDLIVINKPSGLVVHPAAGHQNDTLVNALINHTDDLSMKFGDDRPGIVHRIDKETSGLLVIAKNDEAHLNLSQQFKDRSIQRRYEAITIGHLQPKEGRMLSYLARHPTDRKRYASVKDQYKKIITDSNIPPEIGKLAITNFNLLGHGSGLSLVQLKLETGRTHQIRVHLSEKGFPILGDHVYGAGPREKNLKKDLQIDLKKYDRFFLHAKTLGFIHPTTKKELFFEKDWPLSEKEFIQKWLGL